MSVQAAIDLSSDRIRVDDVAPDLAGRAGLVGGGALGVAVVLGFLGGSEAFFRGYLLNFAYFLSLTLGAFFFVLIQHATRAGWSVVVRRLAEQVMAGFPLMAALSLPLVLAILLGWPNGIHAVYAWTDPELVAHDALLQYKRGYLNGGFFFVRVLIYFGVWIWLGNYLYQRSLRQDVTGDVRLTSEMQAISSPGLILFALTTSFAAFDFLMSLDPHWFSTMFGVYYFAGAAVGAFALLAVLMFTLQAYGRLERCVTTEHYHDVGKLVFAFVVFWAYIAYSQYMLIWYSNLPEETGWYLVRQQGPWLAVSLALLFGHFIVPFLGLISRIPKRRKQTLLIGALWVLALHWVDMFWLVLPRNIGHGAEARVAGLDVWELIQCAVCFIGVGGVFVWGLAGRMARAALIPERDPRLGESLGFENL